MMMMMWMQMKKALYKMLDVKVAVVVVLLIDRLIALPVVLLIWVV